jgi:hypothetical protein
MYKTLILSGSPLHPDFFQFGNNENEQVAAFKIYVKNLKKIVFESIHEGGYLIVHPREDFLLSELLCDINIKNHVHVLCGMNQFGKKFRSRSEGSFLSEGSTVLGEIHGDITLIRYRLSIPTRLSLDRVVRKCLLRWYGESILSMYSCAHDFRWQNRKIKYLNVKIKV